MGQKPEAAGEFGSKILQPRDQRPTKGKIRLVVAVSILPLSQYRYSYVIYPLSSVFSLQSFWKRGSFRDRPLDSSLRL